MTKVNTNFYAYEASEQTGVTKFFVLPTLEQAKALAVRLNCAWGVSDVALTIDIVGGRLVIVPIDAGTTESIVGEAPMANRRGRRGRKPGRRPAAATSATT
jgi:hypothetical protein